MDNLNEIINKLKNVEGLANIHLLNIKDIKKIDELEDKSNLGVREAIRRSFVLLITHDYSFRDPYGELIVNIANKHILPPLAFPEIDANNVVSSSPNNKVHQYLIKRFKLKLKDEATLIIGFDL